MKRIIVRILLAALSVLPVAAIILSPSPVYAAWLGTWAHRIEITIDTTNVDADLANYPVYLNISAASGIGDVDVTAIYDEIGANYLKQAVTLADGTTECYVEVVSWDNVGEVAEEWVNVTAVDDAADTLIYIYYDSTHADNSTYVGVTGSTPGKAVWDDNYNEVLHGNDGSDTSHVTGSKTGASYAKKGAAEPAVATGLIGKAQTFDVGQDDYITLSSLGLGTTHTLEVLRKDNSPDGYLVCLGADAGNNRMLYYWSGGPIMIYTAQGVQVSVIRTVTNGVWQIFTVSRDGTAVRFFANGAQVSTTKTLASNPTLTVDRIGNLLDLLIDELRISKIKRSDAHIKANDPNFRDNLVTFGAEETALFLPLAPTDFIITQINVDEAQADWTMGVNATTTLVRIDTGDYPTTITDGYEDYNGAGITFTHDGLLFDQYRYYWSAWSHNATGYSVNYATGTLGGDNLELLASKFGVLILFLIAGGFAVFARWSRSTFITLMAGAVIIGVGTYYIYMDPSAWLNIIIGVAGIAVGLYLLIMEGVDLLRGN